MKYAGESGLNFCRATPLRSDALWEAVLLSRGASFQNSISPKLQSKASRGAEEAEYRVLPGVVVLE